jgi:hypothetical protein
MSRGRPSLANLRRDLISPGEFVDYCDKGWDKLQNMLLAMDLKVRNDKKMKTQNLFAT